MGGSVLTGFANLPVADKRLINEICERFEDCLKQGETTRAEEFASDLTVPLRSILLQELLLLECEYRFRRMNPPLEEELNCRLKGDEEICRVILSAARENSLCHAPLGERPGLFPEYARWLEATGQFKILRVLGRGGFGVVFQADSSRLGGYVALKVPLAGPSAPREFRDRFLREGRAVSRLEHPNIAATLEVSEAGPLCYIASEYVAGLHLGEWLAERGGALCPQEAANLIRTLSRAIA
ncbi:hypothetical protein BH10PLA2_BH10PLA2_23170 [soil metagenome]